MARKKKAQAGSSLVARRRIRVTDELIDAAAKVFADYGYHGASTRNIAEQIGMRQSNLYYYFDSKEAALELVCHRTGAGYVRRLKSVVESDLSTLEKIRETVFQHLEFLKDRQHYFVTFMSCRRFLPTPARHRIGRLSRQYEALLEELLKEGVRKAELRKNLDCHMAMIALLALLNNARFLYGEFGEYSIEALSNTIVDLFLKGIVK